MSESPRPAVERVHPPDVLWKYLVNPLMRTLLRAPTHRLVDRHLLLRYHGRRSGQPYTVPVGYHWIDGRPCVLSNAGWRVNFRGGHPVAARFRGAAYTPAAPPSRRTRTRWPTCTST